MLQIVLYYSAKTNERIFNLDQQGPSFAKL